MSHEPEIHSQAARQQSRPTQEERRSNVVFVRDEEGSSKGSRIFLITVGLLVLGAAAWGVKKFTEKPAPKRAPLSLVAIVPPPPPASTPPPPPPVQQEQPKQEMIEQAPVTEEDSKPEAPKDEPPDLGTGIKGDGPADGFGLSGKGGNGTGAKGNGSRSKWGWYAGQVQSRIAEVLRKDRRTRTADLRLTVKVWPDASGRITRATLAESTGNSALDEAIKNEVLTGIQLQEPPPAGMPSPIVLRITARRPH